MSTLAVVLWLWLLVLLLLTLAAVADSFLRARRTRLRSRRLAAGTVVRLPLERRDQNVQTYRKAR